MNQIRSLTALWAAVIFIYCVCMMVIMFTDGATYRVPISEYSILLYIDIL